MTTIHLGKKLISLRREANMTQEELATYMGVSKSSVSKWETETTLPDILLLPQLATLFNVSVDELIGYEPQLSMKAVNEFYIQLSTEWSQDAGKAYEHSEELIRKYYSCFPFLLQMAVLYLNHYMLHKQPDLVLKRCEELCNRIIQESEENSLVKDAISLKITYLLASKQPAEALQLLGEEAKPIAQDSEMIASCYQMLGKPKQASRIFQICIYQHLLFVIQDMANYMMLNIGDDKLCDETIHRILEMLKLFHIDALHTITSAMVYVSCAMVYAGRKDKEATLQMMERLVDVVVRYDLAGKKIHRDVYFTEIESWMAALQLRTQAPRDAGVILDSVIQELQLPVFAIIEDEPRYHACIQKLQAEKEKA